MKKKIDIGIWTYSKIYSVYADTKTKEFIVGEQELGFSKDFVKQAIAIVKNWPDHLENFNRRDGVIYKITYNDGHVERTVSGNNKTPDDFNKLMMLVANCYPKSCEELIREELKSRGIEDLL